MPDPAPAEDLDRDHRSKMTAATVGRALLTGAVLFTRIPVRVSGSIGAHDLAAALAWAPVLGAVLGLCAAAVLAFLVWVGLPGSIAGLLALAALIVLTGAYHEDGLADVADGLFGGNTRERRLEIMRDSRIGAYGTIALILSLGLRWAALVALLDGPTGLLGATTALVATQAASRAVPAGLVATLTPARPDGLAAKLGRASAGSAARRHAWLSAALGGGIALLAVAAVSPLGLILALAFGAAAGAALAALARAKVGGYTGDVLGAGQQAVEIVALIALAAWH